jgi:amino-acid N-acetyltransferase
MTSTPPVGEDDLQALRGLLRTAGLPDDVGDHSETLLAVARDGDEVVGGVAVEVHGGYGLLRSLVVDAAVRSSGVAKGLVASAEAAAGSFGLGELHLLTETAAGFFEGLGYARIERSDVPEAVRASSEFAELCPDTAVAMKLEL